MADTFPLSARNVVTTPRWHLSSGASFYLQASITFLFLAGSSAPTPLYSIYQRLWDFSPVTVTVIFGVYALAVLAALLVTGRLSDHIGRRPVLIATSLTQAMAMLMLATAHGELGLIAGRIIQGLAAGAAVSAVGAGLIDLDRARGTLANSIAPIMGTATGALLGGLTGRFLPAPTHLIYGVFGVLFLSQCAGLTFMRETNFPVPGAFASLKPQFAMPAAVKASMLLAMPVLIATWSLAGFYGAIAPTLIRKSFDLDASLYGGSALFLLAASGAVTVLFMRNHSARAMMIVGTTALLGGVGAALLAVSAGSATIFFVGTVLAGVGFGAGFQGAIRSILPLALSHERAGVLSVIFVVSYLSMGLPAIAAGFALAAGLSLTLTADVFGALVMGLSAIALLSLLPAALRPTPAS